ncbi:hypothetical protein [Collimonas sp.]|uniref:hypothetical protein n=1 Tax=Collimonas sp. TaxID=1963772 RepID=UPI0037BE672F
MEIDLSAILFLQQPPDYYQPPLKIATAFQKNTNFKSTLPAVMNMIAVAATTSPLILAQVSLLEATV